MNPPPSFVHEVRHARIRARSPHAAQRLRQPAPALRAKHWGAAAGFGLCLALCLSLAPGRAHAQQAPGADAPIVIPGNAEHAPLAHGIPPWAALALKKQPPAQTEVSAASTGSIVIPGTREPRAQESAALQTPLQTPFTKRAPDVEHPAMPSLPTIPAGPSLGSVVHVDAGRVAKVVVQPEAAPRTAWGPVRAALIPVSVPAHLPPSVAPHAQVIPVSPPLLPAPQTAARPAPGNTVGDAIRATAEQFLRQQTVGLPGQIGIVIKPVSPRGLATCTGLEAFLPPGSRLWGRTMVGVRCLGQRPWTLYVQAQISVQATYYVAARDIAPGDTIQQADLVARDGDLANLPRSVVTDPAQAVGALAQNRITAGLPLRQDMIREPLAVQLGQTVRIVASGNGFSISTEGSALQNAATGQPVRVKTQSGEVVSGIVQADDTVQVPL